ncbi:hypothetical protein [Streptomyces anandii]|uniref:hypothetical protein n=1 Tax=Streptomyces anandii TaxID=285454 RepID=UPI000ADDE693|nr:hypothetical protein [Streptomyces anandii]GGX98308.1 hypothetical protein GCM10010510_49880 [Streptomyces anandii JCM 4720]
MTRGPKSGRTALGDLVAFLGVLCAGVVLICVGHVSPQALAGVCVALGSLYAAWVHRSRQQGRSGKEEE